MLLLALPVVFCLMLSPGGAGAQLPDDHGNSYGTATDLSLGSSLAGRIDYGLDKDVFRLDLSGATGYTNAWIYTTGDFDTVGQLHDRNGVLIASNDDLLIGAEHDFHLRAILPSGVYFIAVFGYDDNTTGNYTIHAQVATDHGQHHFDTATGLSLDIPAVGTIDTTSDADYFRLEFTESKNVMLHANSGNFGPLDVTALDARGAEISVNIYSLHTRYSSYTARDGFVIRDDFGPGTYYIKVTTPKVTTPEEFTIHPLPYTILASEDSAYTEFIDGCEAISALNDPHISDSLHGCQWHLNSDHETNINVEDAWAEGAMGEGVNVVLVDDGMDYTHEDLIDNVDASRNHDYSGDGDIFNPLLHHGTKIAGVLAARDNDIGVRGVAPRSTIYGYNFLAGAGTISRLTDALTRNMEVTAVSNNSWGMADDPRLMQASSFWELAITAGINRGYNGKGTFYVFSGGNGHLDGDNSNLEEYANYYGVTAVCAVNERGVRSSYSEMGANLWICAPSGDHGIQYRGITTTENSDRYVDDLSGTSMATPIVSGVAALMRGVNPDLTWRELKLILAASARKNDAGNSGWEDGAPRYGSNSDADRYHFNHEYGFGLVDAKAAVDLARGWSNIPALERSTTQSGLLDVQIPDAPNVGAAPTFVSTLTLDTNIGFTEYVEIAGSFHHGSFRDLEIELVSPSGAVSKLVEEFDTYSNSFGLVSLNSRFRFGSAKHLGEDPNGEWQLLITDRLPGVDGTFESWSITVYGHERMPGPPTVDSITAVGNSLTVAWTVPDQTAGLPVSSYDLRHILSDADETMDSNWSVVEDVWTAAAPGNLEYAIEGLVPRERYDVQVRATNDWGHGDWSAIATGTPGNARPTFVQGSATERAILENSLAGSNVGDPVVATDADGDTLIYTLGGDDAASFVIDDGTGQITVGAGTILDYETQTTYTVVATATDPFDVVETATVTIMVTNVDLPGKGNDYDADNNEMIDKGEVIAALTDYIFNDVLTKAEIIEIIRLYLFR